MSTRELLARYAHDAWSGWMRYMFGLSGINSDGTATIPAELVSRWLRQSATDYADLPSDEQRSDLTEADRILAICGPDPTAEALAKAVENYDRDPSEETFWAIRDTLRAYRSAHPEVEP